MKKLLLVVLAIAGYMANAQPVKVHGNLQVKGTQLLDSKGDPVVLRGMSFGWHNFWPRFYNAGAVNELSNNWNCTVIRAAMGVEPARGYKEKPEESVKMIRDVVDAAIKQGVYVIIDWHSHNINLPEAKKFFTEMATAYGKYPNVIYEIFNEPDQETWADVKAYSTEVMNAIRAIDKDNIILVGNPHWDQDIHTVADDPLTGFTNIMYTVHFYAATHKKFLRDRCDYALKKNIPIFISESAGMEASGDGPLNETEWTAWIDWCETNKISWITWSVSDKNESCSVLLPTAPSDGNWPDSVLRQSGIMSKTLLKKYGKPSK